MRSTLTITPAPFRSSHLTIPPSPFSPKIPISPNPKPQTKPASPKIALTTPPPPAEPLKWLWQCHCCARIYHLGTTRRCLDDGHYFCAGAPVTKRDRKTGLKVTRKSRACASEFDYQGWKSWGNWRRDVEEQRAAAEALAAFDAEVEVAVAVESDGDLRVEDVAKEQGLIPKPLFAKQAVPAVMPEEGEWLSGNIFAKKAAAAALLEKDCWNTCDYPSECRWGKQFGAAQTRAQVVVTPQAVVPSIPPPPPPPSTMVAEPVVKDLEQPSKSLEGLASVPATIEEVPEAEADATSGHSHDEQSTTVQETTRKPTFDDLLESAKRRKRRSASIEPSPLASNPPSPIEEEGSQQASAHTLQKAFDDFELDVRKSIGRASLLLNGLLKGNGTSEEDKAEAFVKGLKTGRKKKKMVREEGDQSLSD